MMNGVFLRIGSTDVSEYLDIQSYSMNSTDVYDTWTDGNWIDHRVVTRQRIAGKVKAGFASEADHAAFLALLESAKDAESVCTVTAYVNNKGAAATFSAFIDTDGEGRWDLINGRQWLVVNLTITGR